MFDRYSERARQAILEAKGTACRLGHPEVSAEHLLLVLLDDVMTIGRVLDDRAVQEVRDEIVAHIGRRDEMIRIRDLPLNSEAREVLALGEEEADRSSSESVCNEHLLLGILRVGTCYAARILMQRGLTIGGVHSAFPIEPSGLWQAWRVLWRSFVARGRSRPDKEQALMRQIAQLVGKGRSRDALKLLDDFIAAPGDDRVRRIRAFAPHAAGIAYGIGDFDLVKRYCDLDLTNSPDSLLSLSLMAEVNRLQGDREQARKYAMQCYHSAALREDRLSKDLATHMRQRFSEFGPYSEPTDNSSTS